MSRKNTSSKAIKMQSFNPDVEVASATDGPKIHKLTTDEKKQKIQNRIEKSRVTRSKVGFFCRAAAWRIIEAMVAILSVSFVAILIGSFVIPSLGYETGMSAALTQNTNIYQAYMAWLLPMLFYVLLITAGTYAVLKFLLKKWHLFISAHIAEIKLKMAGELD